INLSKQLSAQTSVRHSAQAQDNITSSCNHVPTVHAVHGLPRQQHGPHDGVQLHQRASPQLRRSVLPQLRRPEARLQGAGPRRRPRDQVRGSPHGPLPQRPRHRGLLHCPGTLDGRLHQPPHGVGGAARRSRAQAPQPS
ncbi:hypothetical protein BKA80DRAFT_343644, partial [Phyllosticta citrichinensis]